MRKSIPADFAGSSVLCLLLCSVVSSVTSAISAVKSGPAIPSGLNAAGRRGIVPRLSPRPNLLLITTDQQRHDHLGLKGLTAIATPHLDRLGREGVHFERAYCPSPTCTPARVSLLTGQYPSSHRAYYIGVTVDPFPRPTLPDLLAGDGFAPASFGNTQFVRR